MTVVPALFVVENTKGPAYDRSRDAVNRTAGTSTPSSWMASSSGA
ncbi:MAG TPA: hypothetical protein VNV44_14535 [Solirubrobacteraceae bacterium]|nr:hypothetical protein [Solirubrobacteraceae bacterium]